MVQVHTLRDLESQPFPRQGNADGMVHTQPYQKPSFVEVVFPGFKAKTFIVAVTIAQIGVYIASCILGSNALNPFHTSLTTMGASYGPKIARGEIWRLVTPIFLHANFWHLLFNCFFQLRMGFPIEAEYGIKTFSWIYMACGIAGNLVSVAWAPCKTAVGASTSGFGLIGIQMAQVALTWHLMQRKEDVVFNIMFFVMMTVFMSSAPDSVLDWRGHFGGFAAGFGIAVILDKSTNKPTWHGIGRIVSMATLGALTVGSLAVIFAIPMHNRGC